MMREIAVDADIGSDESAIEVDGEGSVDDDFSDVTDAHAAGHGMEFANC